MTAWIPAGISSAMVRELEMAAAANDPVQSPSIYVLSEVGYTALGFP